MLPALGAARAAEGETAAAAAAAASDTLQRFRYRTVRVSDPEAVPQEAVTMEVRAQGAEVTTVYRSERKDSAERAVIRMCEDGNLLEGRHADIDARGRETTRSRIWVEAGTVYTERVRPSGRRSVRSRRLNGKDVVADAGLLYRLRTFPFAKASSMEFLMAAFDQYFITMRVALAGAETVCVPAGTFDCYRLEATIDLWIREFKMTYWLARRPPHFLVCYEGKRGLFLSPTYRTSLVAIETNVAAAASSPP
jgi:hypothetical protein